MNIGTQQRSAAKAKIVTVKYDRLQLSNGEYVEGAFDKIEYADDRQDIFLITMNDKTKKMKLENGTLIDVK